MQLSRAVVSAVALWALAQPGVAHGGEPGDPTTISAQAAGYIQTDSGGIAEIDEDAAIVEGIIVLDMDLGDSDRLKVKATVDVVSSASIRREHNRSYRALQSEATGSIRGSASLGWLHSFGDFDLELRGAGGAEYAYRSMGGGTTLTWRLFDKNTTLSVGVDALFDTVAMIRYDGRDEADEARTTVTSGLTWTQILTPRSLMNLSAGFTHQSGFLAGQFNSVFVSGTEDYEILPGSRDRVSLTGRYKHAIGQLDAIEVGARVYADDWGIGSGTAELRYFLHLSESHQLELDYRFYAQGGADHYRASFAEAQQFQTSDPDLGDFTGHLGGLQFRILGEAGAGGAGSWNFGLSYYYRDNGLSMAWLTLGHTLGL